MYDFLVVFETSNEVDAEEGACLPKMCSVAVPDILSERN